MRRFASILLACALSSCAFDHYKATSATGNTVEETYASAGGTASIKRSDGSSFVHDHQASFKDAVQGGVTVAGGLASASVSKAQTASNNAKDLGLAKIGAHKEIALSKIQAASQASAARATNFGSLIGNGSINAANLGTLKK
jgi:hypothetical protein